ncbi:MAG TPA: hypothetical protein DCR44_02325 [Acholeplasmatales bacterium]|nr:MAG: hypothetical protein A2Y16_01670 [Tenericutes bacterium GWF2_57_13]HAQ56228.1 hypothetical protein [Acholeplasmatales bacterium]
MTIRLHLLPEFDELCTVTSRYRHLPEQAIRRDYFIVMALGKLSTSIMNPYCILKGGTSLSKCHPGSIERFSEDIDLVYQPKSRESHRAFERNLQTIEKIMSDGMSIEPIAGERSAVNKSAYIWYDEHREDRIKLEIGSAIRAEPRNLQPIQSYIQDFLVDQGHLDDIRRFELRSYEIQCLDITRTYIEKLLAIKQHAYDGSLARHVRHIHDVVMLTHHENIVRLLNDLQNLKAIVSIAKQDATSYLENRSIPIGYASTAPYEFRFWETMLSRDVREQYESLHKSLLYTDQKPSLDDAIDVLRSIDDILTRIGE